MYVVTGIISVWTSKWSRGQLETVSLLQVPQASFSGSHVWCIEGHTGLSQLTQEGDNGRTWSVKYATLPWQPDIAGKSTSDYRLQLEVSLSSQIGPTVCWHSFSLLTDWSYCLLTIKQPLRLESVGGQPPVVTMATLAWFPQEVKSCCAG